MFGAVPGITIMPKARTWFWWRAFWVSAFGFGAGSAFTFGAYGFGQERGWDRTLLLFLHFIPLPAWLVFIAGIVTLAGTAWFAWVQIMAARRGWVWVQRTPMGVDLRSAAPGHRGRLSLAHRATVSVGVVRDPRSRNQHEPKVSLSITDGTQTMTVGAGMKALQINVQPLIDALQPMAITVQVDSSLGRDPYRLT